MWKVTWPKRRVTGSPDAGNELEAEPVTEGALSSYQYLTYHDFAKVFPEIVRDLELAIKDAYDLANRANVALSRHKTETLKAISVDSEANPQVEAITPQAGRPRRIGQSMRHLRGSRRHGPKKETQAAEMAEAIGEDDPAAYADPGAGEGADYQIG